MDHDDFADVDPKVPVLRGESIKDFQRYEKVVTATALGLSDDEREATRT